MRRAVDFVAAAITVVVCTGLGTYFYFQQQESQRLADVSAGLRRFEQVLAFRGASKEAETSERGWPLTVDPTWFASDAPRNFLVTPDRPWLEVATPEQADLLDPPVRIALSNTTAAFWYNPYKGIIRARVPIAISDQKALELYNAANGTSLDNIYCAEAAPAPTADPAPAPTGEPVLDPTTTVSLDPAPLKPAKPPVAKGASGPTANASAGQPVVNPFKSQLPSGAPSKQAQVPEQH
jgi:hypothetical protein